MNYIYVASPLGAETYEGIQENICRAVWYCKRVWRNQQSIPVAPHIYFPRFLDDMNAADRAVGTCEGMKLLAQCDEVYAFAEDFTHASSGMKAEIELAETLGIPVTYVS